MTRPAVPAVTSDKPVAVSSTDSAPDANEYVLRGLTLFEQGKPEAAIKEYLRGIANDPLDLDTWFNLAWTYHELGREKLALDTYAKALGFIEHAPALRVPYAELLYNNKRNIEARQVLKDGIALDPDYSAEMKALLGRIAVAEMNNLATLEESEEPSARAPAGTNQVAATPGMPMPEKGRSPRPTSRQKRDQRKKLCKRFCPGTLK